MLREQLRLGLPVGSHATGRLRLSYHYGQELTQRNAKRSDLLTLGLEGHRD